MVTECPTRAEVSPNRGLLSRPLVPYVRVVNSSIFSPGFPSLFLLLSESRNYILLQQQTWALWKTIRRLTALRVKADSRYATTAKHSGFNPWVFYSGSSGSCDFFLITETPNQAWYSEEIAMIQNLTQIRVVWRNHNNHRSSLFYSRAWNVSTALTGSHYNVCVS